MSKTLLVENKKYYTSSILAQKFSYTPDYLSRLAREEKVDAMQIGRQWYLSEQSLIEFKTSSEAEKHARSIELRKLRQEERLLHEQAVQEVTKPPVASGGHLAFGQSVAVAMCSVLVGVLGWSLVDSDVSSTDVLLGIAETYTQIARAVVPSENPFDAPWALTALVSESSLYAEEGDSAEVPAPAADVVDGGVDSSFSALGFSDEVEVVFEEDGTGTVRPVFKEKKGTDAVYQYQIVRQQVNPSQE